MPRSNPEARERLLAAAGDMLRRRGLSATSIREVAKHAQAPLGSTYHYFPGGKQQMVSEAVQATGEMVAGMLRKRLEAGALEGLRAFLALWRSILLNTEFRAGCPVLAVATEEPDEDSSSARQAAACAFACWETLLADALEAQRPDRAAALNLASTIVAAVEGALALCRAHRDIAPFDRVATTLEQLVAQHLQPVAA